MGAITKVALGKFIRIARGDISNYADVITQAASTAINETAEEGICFGEPEEAPPGDVFINKAFFAEKKVEDVYDETTEEYTVVSGDNLSVIAGEYEGVSYQDIMEENGLTSTEIDVGDKLHITSRTKVGETTRFEQITAGNIGEEVYIVVEHFGTLSSLRATLKEKEPLLTDGGALAVMQDDSEVTAIELCEPEEEELKGIYYYAKIKLRPEEDETLETWREKLQDKELVGYSDTENQRTVSPEAFGAMTPIGMEPIYDTVKSLLSIEVEARAEEGDVVYCGRDRSNVFLNEDGEWFEVGGATCYCNRDLTEEEVKEIIIALRKSESSVYTGDNKENLFWKSNCDIPSSDKSFTRFTEELNNVFNTYEINTCIRRIHFLAQIYHETDRLRTSEEYNTSANYAPYIGRGLMQLTWESNYKIYGIYSGIDCVEDPEIIGNDLFNSFDSAGWFWKQGKVLSVGETWSPPSSAPDYVTNVNSSYSKTIISYQDNGETKQYGTIDLNLIADDDYVDVISWLVNGGGNGLQERRDYIDELKKIFKYDTDCENNK